MQPFGSGRVLICGSVAYDTTMVFGDRFRNHILPEQIHLLNVSFLVSQMRREFGGCAGNIATNMRLLGDVGLPMATVGHDFGPYADRLRRIGVPLDHVRVIDTENTAQAFLTADLDNNQIVAFHPGAMLHSHLNQASDAVHIRIGVIAPDGRDGMLTHAEQFSRAGIPFLFDPGQALPLFNGEELRRFIALARWIAVNEYEWSVVKERTGWGLGEVLGQGEALIVTRGAAGSTIYTPEHTLEIPAPSPVAIVDPTGCGDAYRAGILHGLLHGLDWATTGRIASLMGAIKIAKLGTQNHHFTKAEFEQRFLKAFGAAAHAALLRQRKMHVNQVTYEEGVR